MNIDPDGIGAKYSQLSPLERIKFFRAEFYRFTDTLKKSANALRILDTGDSTPTSIFYRHWVQSIDKMQSIETLSLLEGDDDSLTRLPKQVIESYLPALCHDLMNPVASVKGHLELLHHAVNETQDISDMCRDEIIKIDEISQHMVNVAKTLARQLPESKV